MNRFARQEILPGFGSEGQQKLSAAKVLVVGAGGLGCPALSYLAAAGIGTIGIADGDHVAASNLNRQTLFGQNDIGKPKAETAAKVLQQKYPDIKFIVISEFLTVENTLKILRNYDLVIDGSDNFGTRYMLNDACFLLKIPLIMGAIFQYEGQISVFNFGENPINYRDIYPVPPQANEIPNCSEAGVFGVLPGIIGTLQAAETIKVLSGIGEVLRNKILIYNMKSCQFCEIEIEPNPAARKFIPKNNEAFQQKEYGISCGSVENISWENALERTQYAKNSTLIDIREVEEEPKIFHSFIEKIPMSNLLENSDQLAQVEEIILFCKTGKRSGKLAQQLKDKFPEKKIFSVEGGISNLPETLKTEKNEA